MLLKSDKEEVASDIYKASNREVDDEPVCFILVKHVSSELPNARHLLGWAESSH